MNSFSTFEKPFSFFSEKLTELLRFLRVGGSMLLPAQVCILDNLMQTQEKWYPVYKLHLLDEAARDQVCPMFAAHQKLQQLGKQKLDIALSKNGKQNIGANSTLTLKKLRKASEKSKSLLQNTDEAGLIVLLQLERKAMPATNSAQGNQQVGRLNTKKTSDWSSGSKNT